MCFTPFKGQIEVRMDEMLDVFENVGAFGRDDPRIWKGKDRDDWVLCGGQGQWK